MVEAGAATASGTASRAVAARRAAGRTELSVGRGVRGVLTAGVRAVRRRRPTFHVDRAPDPNLAAREDARRVRTDQEQVGVRGNLDARKLEGAVIDVQSGPGIGVQGVVVDPGDRVVEQVPDHQARERKVLVAGPEGHREPGGNDEFTVAPGPTARAVREPTAAPVGAAARHIVVRVVGEVLTISVRQDDRIEDDHLGREDDLSGVRKLVTHQVEQSRRQGHEDPPRVERIVTGGGEAPVG